MAGGLHQVELLHLVELVARLAVELLHLARIGGRWWLSWWPVVAPLHAVELVTPCQRGRWLHQAALPAVPVAGLLASLRASLLPTALARQTTRHRRSVNKPQFVQRFHRRACPMIDPHRLTWRPCQVGAATISGACIGACNERKRWRFGRNPGAGAG